VHRCVNGASRTDGNEGEAANLQKSRKQPYIQRRRGESRKLIRGEGGSPTTGWHRPPRRKMESDWQPPSPTRLSTLMQCQIRVRRQRETTPESGDPEFDLKGGLSVRRWELHKCHIREAQKTGLCGGSSQIQRRSTAKENVQRRTLETCKFNQAGIHSQIKK